MTAGQQKVKEMTASQQKMLEMTAYPQTVGAEMTACKHTQVRPADNI
jgi:hypothetical protein